MTERHDLSVERVIDAPAPIVWRAWTEHLEEWFCPRPWRTELIELRLETGGRSAIMLRGPAGEEQLLDDVVLEVVPGRRIVSTDAFTAGWQPQQPFMVRIDSFEALGDDRTRYTATARHWTAEARDRHVAMGFEAGWGACADQLAEVARRLADEAG